MSDIRNPFPFMGGEVPGESLSPAYSPPLEYAVSRQVTDILECFGHIACLPVSDLTLPRTDMAIEGLEAIEIDELDIDSGKLIIGQLPFMGKHHITRPGVHSLERFSKDGELAYSLAVIDAKLYKRRGIKDERGKRASRSMLQAANVDLTIAARNLNTSSGNDTLLQTAEYPKPIYKPYIPNSISRQWS